MCEHDAHTIMHHHSPNLRVLDTLLHAITQRDSVRYQDGDVVTGPDITFWV